MRFLTPIAVATLLAVAACGGERSSTTSPTQSAQPTVATSNIAGTYNVTITVSSACASSLAQTDRQRVFLMSVAQTGRNVDGTLIGSAIGGLSGTVTGTSLAFILQVADQASPLKLWAIGFAQGTATVSSSAAGLSGTFSDAVITSSGTCSATNHSISFAKR